MPLDDNQAKWISRFTAGAVALPPNLQPAPGDTAARAEELRNRQGQERVEEQALKEVLLAKAFRVVDRSKEELRDALDMEATAADKSGKETTQRVKDPRGQAQHAFDSTEAPNLTKVPTRRGDGKAATTDAQKAFAILVTESDTLAAQMVERSYLDEKTGKIKTRPERLFTDAEIMDQLYTPLVRELVVPETIVPDKYSATQKMIDTSNTYYVKECQAKGKELATGWAAFGKGAVDIGATVTKTVLAALGPVTPGQDGMANSGTLDKITVAHATDITTGVAATLSGLIDVVDQVDDFRESGDFSVAGYETVMNNFALGIGKIVSAATNNVNDGLAVTDALSAGVTASSLIAELTLWRKRGGEPPAAAIIDAIGSAIAGGFSVTSDLASGSASTAWAQAGVAVGAAFSTAAKAAEVKLTEALRKGDWTSVFEVLSAACQQASKAVPVAVRFAAQYNAMNNVDSEGQPDNDKNYQDQQKLLKSLTDLNTALDKGGDAAETLLEETAKSLGISGPMTASGKVAEEIERKFSEKQAALEQLSTAEEAQKLVSIQKKLDQERKDYEESLKCLGSTDPTDADYKSIAKLLEQMQRDRAIWDSVNALFGGALGAGSAVATAAQVAAEVVPALKAAGQLAKFIANLKAAADRLAAFLDWTDAQRDAESAVSPYGTSIQNMVKNQGSQFTHYTLQTAHAAIQALLTAGEMSPLAPAFKVAGAAVGASASVEELIYKFAKHQALRKAWNDTKEALDPKNKGNRKMALLVREINPTLAKYTIAYGALIEESPIAITALNRIGLDRETLARTGDKVDKVKEYLEKLYRDDNVVVGTLEAPGGPGKLPAPQLTSKAWALTYLLLQEKEKLATPNPPDITVNLVIIEPLLKKPRKDLEIEDYDRLMRALVKLETAFLAFDPRRATGELVRPARDAALRFAEVAQATNKALQLDLAAKRAA